MKIDDIEIIENVKKIMASKLRFSVLVLKTKKKFNTFLWFSR